MNISMIKTVVLNTLGLSKFIKNDQGNLDLSDEHKNTLTGIFGQEFTEKFAAKLNLEKADSSSTSEKNEEDATDLVASLRAHHASVISKGLNELNTELQGYKNQVTKLQADKVALQGAVAKLSAEGEELPRAEIIPGAGKKGSQTFKYKADSPIYAGVDEFLATGNSTHISAATIDVADLKSEFGKYLSQNQNGLELLKKLFVGFTSAKFFTVKRAVTEWRAIKSLITSVSQQFTAVWTPGGKFKFAPLTIINRRHKINVGIVPADVLDSYMFHLYDESLTPSQMPVTLYIWNEEIYPALLQDIEMRMIWKGKFVDHAGTQVENSPATAPEDSMDGLETILVEAKVSGDKGVRFFKPNTLFDFKAAAAAGQWQEILNFVEEFVAWLSPFYKTTQMPLFISDDNKRIYKRAYKQIWGTGSGQDSDFGKDRVDYSNLMITAPDGMFNSPIIFSTPKLNMIMLRHKNEVPNIINNVQERDYEVRIFGEYWLGVGFAMGNAVFAYVPTGYDPKAQITAAIGDFDDYQEDWNTGDGEAESDDSGI